MKDLFETPELIPAELKALFDEYEEQICNGFSYAEIHQMYQRTKALGYVFEFYLDAQPYALRPLGTRLNEIEGYEHIKPI